MRDLHCFTIESPKRTPTGTGVLDGLKFAAKDLIAIKGHISSFGHAQWRKTHKPAVRDAPIITKLLEEGAELVGTTKMDQLAFSIIGNIGEGEAPVNTKYPERFCGGSSCGSASAVAGGLVDFAIGSDSGGSIRIPAAACGVYGIRPTLGVVPMNGTIGLAKSADVLGFFARTPEILKRVTSVFCEPHEKCLRFSRLVLPHNLQAYTQLDVDKLTAQAMGIAQRNDLRVERKDVSRFVSQEVKDVFGRVLNREIWAAHGHWVQENMGYLADDAQAGFNKCRELVAGEDAVAQSDEEFYARYKLNLATFLGQDAVLCLPILPESGPTRDLAGEQLASFRNRAFMNIAPASIAGLPEVSAPLLNGTSNIGLVGPKFSDLDLLGLIS